MNPILEQKLRELIGEAERQAAPAMCVVLNLLLGAYLSGKQNDFAKHCSKFSPFVMTSMSLKTEEGEEFWSDTRPNAYVN